MTVRRNEKLTSNADVEALLRVYRDGTRVEAGVIHFTGSRFVSWQLDELVPDAFSITPPLGRRKAIHLFRRALRAARLAGQLTAQSLLDHAQSLHQADRAVPEVSYTLWTKFRASSMPFNKGFRLRWDGVDMRTVHYLPSWLRLPEYFLNGFGRVYPDEPIFYGYIIVSCRDRDDSEAATRMLDALQLVMCLVNIYEGWGGGRYSGPPKPDGALWLGPYQFLFRGRKSIKEMWFNPDYTSDSWTSLAPSMDKVLPHIPRVRRALAALSDHPLRRVLLKSLNLMQDGLSTHDGNYRLLRYWSALEQLYVEEGSRERSNQKVIDRAAFAENEPRLARWTLNHIARLRNDYVHAGGADDDLGTMAEFLRDLLSRHLNHWIFTGQTFADHQALLNYVSLPSDPTALRRLRDAIDRRLDLHKPRRPNDAT